MSPNRAHCLAVLAFASAGLACGRVDTPVGEVAPASSVPPATPATAADASGATSLYFEAESGLLSGGFTIERDPDASAGEYILPPDAASLQMPGPASATYTFSLALAGSYLLWGRLRAPDVSSNTFWITMDEASTVQWRLSTGDTWYWGAVTSGTQYGQPVVYSLTAGPHRLVIRNSSSHVGLDRLYVTVPGDVPPGNDTPCHPPNSIQLVDGGCQPSCGSHGDTTCGIGDCAGKTRLDAYDCAVCCFAGPSAVLPDAGGD